MGIKTITSMRARLGQAIAWRVSTEMETEREVIVRLQKDLAALSISTTDKIRALEKSLETLQLRIQDLEK